METMRMTLPLPPGVNNQYVTVGRRRVLSREARGFRRSVEALVRDCYSRGVIDDTRVSALREQPVACDLIFFFETPYRRDLDGGLKIALDALFETLGLDDRYIVSITLTKQIDPLNPRVEIELAAHPDWQFDETYVVIETQSKESPSDPCELSEEPDEQP
jgi:crossover junction endodeoxyribonuclease RusA